MRDEPTTTTTDAPPTGELAAKNPPTENTSTANPPTENTSTANPPTQEASAPAPGQTTGREPAFDVATPVEPTSVTDPVIETTDLAVHYGSTKALDDVSISIPRNRVTAIIGPSGCGKSTFLRCINRMNDLVPAAEIEGELRYDGVDVYGDAVDPVALRRQIGMVFQAPNPFPKSIRDNVAYGLRVQGDTDRLDERVQRALERAALWDEVEHRLDESGLELSGGQQQRLCIARAIATDPDVLLMDEPASALDPVATTQIEDLIEDLSEEYTVVIVTHNMQQAARISHETAVFLTGGELAAFDDTHTIFEHPENQRVEDYITGKFG